MSVAAHLAAIETALAGDVVPVVAGDSRASAAVASALEIIRRLITNAVTEPGDPALRQAAIAALDLPPSTDTGPADVSENPDRYLGGTPIRAAADSAAAKRVAAGDFSGLRPVCLWESEELLRADAELEAMRTSTVSVDASDLRIDRERLLAYLRGRFPQWPDLEIKEFRQIAGGRSKQTAIFALANAPDLPNRLVLRRDHPVGISDSSVVDEFPLIKKLFDAGVKVAQPHLIEPSRDHLSGPFLLSSAIDGQSAGSLFEPRHSPALALALAREIAKLHALPVDSYIGLTQRLKPLVRSDHETKLASYEDMWTRYGGPPSPAMRIALAWLKQNIALATGTPTLVHGDLGFHNVLAAGDTYEALLDWEFTTIANPAEDIGYARPTIEKMVPWDQWMNAYREAGGPPVPSAEINFYAIWGSVRLASMVTYARWLVDTGAIKDVGFAQSSIVDLNRLIQRVADALARVL